MKKLLLAIVMYCSATYETDAQTTDTADAYERYSSRFHYEADEYSAAQNENWAKSSGTKTFENQGEMHSAYIALNEDSSFVFISINEGGEFLSIGTWKTINDTTIILNWSKEKSTALCSNKKEKKRYHVYSMALPMKITNWTYVKKTEGLIPMARRPKPSRSQTKFHQSEL